MGTSKCHLLMRALILTIMAISVVMSAAFIVALVIKDCGFSEFMRIPNTFLVLVVLLSFDFAIYLAFKQSWPVRTSVDEKIYSQVLLENGHDYRVGNKKNAFTDTTETDDHVLGELEDTIKAPGTGLDPVLGSACETTLREQVMVFDEEDETFDVEEISLSKLSQDHLGQTIGKEIPISKDLCVEPTDSVSCHNSFFLSENEANARNLIPPCGQALTSKIHSTKDMLDMIDYLAVEGFANGEIVRNAVSAALSQQVAELISAKRNEKNETLKFYNEYACSMNYGQVQESFSEHDRFTDILDDFWGNLFDLHGKLTDKGKIIRLDLLIGLDVEEKIKNCPCCFDGTSGGLCDRFDLVNLSAMKTPSLFRINNSMCPEQGNCTLPAVVELRRCIMDSFLQEDHTLLKDDEVSYFVMENDQVQYEVPIYEKFYRVAKSIGMKSNCTSDWAPCPLEELNTMTVLVQKCPSQQVAQHASKTNVYFSYNELKGLLLNSFRGCILNISELGKSDWLFQYRDGYDEKLIGLAAEMVIFRDIYPNGLFSPNVVVDSDGKMFNVCTSVLGCGDACMWLPSLVISFGVWCISRILEIMLSEKQPVMRGEYSMVLNRLQGILDPAFLKPVQPVPICPCTDTVPSVRVPDASQRTSAEAVLKKLMEVEAFIFGPKCYGMYCREKEKEDLKMVLNRYKLWFSKVTSQE
ncbi:hypothetical protein PAHAL_1G314100 [Panicum hallii]|uniref:Uncharacterized protein n=1 Tax=Panicum hallii TaxID=206008 RepID=A0A2S3GR83_9POAL|nr:uncharacterized protein LOC112894115 isoform X1 [Panicum hallii]XP_025817523.1 uncharacterized protein LOC112894115 isoform X1 [Panicum hallii]XP_025817529.1 uncharacterized protein LOC112894115 isoform X1 [Panicum hallii]XP_025817537.1 uncharacterized protein LOC112894115 isoform X1 [Panicum hallii]PAN07145.1 hypothetical protein PAHAL_1G314100 [Panicum hallii]